MHIIDYISIVYENIESRGTVPPEPRDACLRGKPAHPKRQKDQMTVDLEYRKCTKQAIFHPRMLHFMINPRALTVYVIWCDLDPKDKRRVDPI